MKAPRALLLLAVLGLPALAAPDEKDARFRELAAAYEDVEKSAQWEEVKKRRDAIVALGDLDHPGVVPILYKAFTEDREQVCRIPALIALGKRADFPVLKAVVTAAVRDRNDVYRMSLPLAFAHVKDDRIGPWIARNILPEKKDLALRASVVECLGLLRTPDALEEVRAMAGGEQKDLRLRYEAVFALARIAGMLAFDEIAPLLENAEPTLREAAVLALAETGSPEAIEKALPLAKDDCPLVQEAVAMVARQAKSEAALPALVELLKTGRLRVMDTARAALEEITGAKLGIDAGAWEKWLADRAAGRPRLPRTARDPSPPTTACGSSPTASSSSSTSRAA